MKSYVVYLTVYRGDRLPPFYIGSTSLENFNSGYRGSVRSKQYRKIWLDELELNSHLFSTVVISEHSTRKQAFEAELALQLLVGVPKSPLFINKALASSSFMFGGEHTAETKAKLADGMRGVPKTKEHAEKISQALTGKGKTEEHKKAMQAAWESRDRTLSEDHCTKIAEALKGKARSEQTKSAISNGKRGKPNVKASRPCTIDGITIYPSLRALGKALGSGKSGARHPSFRFV
jgi:hypothetical protein